MNAFTSKSVILVAVIFGGAAPTLAADTIKNTEQKKTAVKTEVKKTSSAETTTTENAASYSDLLPSGQTTNSAAGEQPAPRSAAMRWRCFM